MPYISAPYRGRIARPYFRYEIHLLYYLRWSFVFFSLGVVVDQVISIHPIKMLTVHQTGCVPLLSFFFSFHSYKIDCIWMTIYAHLFRSVRIYKILCLCFSFTLTCSCFFCAYYLLYSHYCGKENCCIKRKAMRDKKTINDLFKWSWKTNRFFFLFKKKDI